MRNRFSELEYRGDAVDEQLSRTMRCLRHAGTWLKERVPWGGETWVVDSDEMRHMTWLEEWSCNLQA